MAKPEKLYSSWIRRRRVLASCKQMGEQLPFLGVHVTTVRRWIHGGLLPAKRLGKRLFVYGGDLLPEDFDRNKQKL